MISSIESDNTDNMSGKRNLFEENSDEEDGDNGLTINKDYAQRYEEWREAEIKRQLEDKYGNVDESTSSSSSDDDDDPEELKQVLSKDFFEVISSLKTKDPKIYNPEVKFFKNEKEQGNLDPLERMRKRKEEKNKPVFLRDYERKLITERRGKLSDDDSDNEEKRERAQSPSYVEEQKQLKDSFRRIIQDDNSDDEGGLLTKKEKSKAEKEKEEEDYIEWLKGERKELSDKEFENSLKPLQSMWNDPKLDDGEKFLRDYVLNKRYLENDAEPLDDGNVTDEDYQEEYMNQFERKYNFRFEEPDREFLKRYPRTMEQSLRKKDTRRKEKRDAVKQRKEEEKQKKKEELKVLKALKRKEILKKIEKIKSITGNNQLGLEPEELEEEFDPEAHDRKMRELFNDDYYEGPDDAEDEDGLNLPPLEEELMDDDNTNWDEWDGTDRNVDLSSVENETGEANEGAYCEDPDFNMDCDYDPAVESQRKEEKASGRQSAREKRKLKRQSRFGRLVRKEKPVFDPNDKTFEQYVDEYYKMDYEDLIGDIPCRFKYKTVAPNSFGLTIEEILAADDKELNQWASLKKTYTIRPDHVEKYEAKVYAQKARDEELKRKILPSLYKNECRDETNTNAGETKKKKKKKRKKIQDETAGEDSLNSTSGQSSKVDCSSSENVQIENDVISDHQTEACSFSSSKPKKKKKEKTSKPEKHEDEHHVDTVSADLVTDKNEKGNKNKKRNKASEFVQTTINSEVNNELTTLKNSKESGKKLKRKYKDGNDDQQQTSKKAKYNSNDVMKSKKSGKWKKNRQEKGTQQQVELSDARLKAYGIHPKRYKNKLKYAPNRK
ncbi:Protein KRI1-like protein [Frankliniella fusca]|uniref:Protein KRI1 homolog n=1 Tax=Frankliniella fusca TaxID=407009 RepID=A0AAE1H0I1_9NEOP|nr:Protein KRI1-like protein [Frankliniella fusca]